MTIFLKKDRWVTSYDLNLTSALQGKASEMEPLLEIHIARRSLLFFIQAWLYHKENCRVLKGRCRWQHGFSKEPYMSAAHSSLLPDLLDNFREVQSSLKKRKLLWPKEPFLISPRCQFYHEMNATILFPSKVNWFDSELEQAVRDQAIQFLNESARGEHPYNALKKLISAQKEFFELKKPSELNTLYKKYTELPPFHRLKPFMLPKVRILKTPWIGNEIEKYTRAHDRIFKRTSLSRPPHRQEASQPCKRHPSSCPRSYRIQYHL